MKHGSLITLLTLTTLFAAGGAACPRMLQQYTAPAPVVFEATPTLDRVIAVVNANSEKINQLQSTGATLSVPGVPSLRTTLHYERSHRFRLIADTSITGVELDMGSNDEMFWMWVKRNRPPAVYFCRHDEFHKSAARDVIPIDPTWVAEALGVAHLDPRGLHEGPYAAGSGRIEIRSRVAGPEGEVTKVTILHAAHGWVLEQHIFDGRGARIASAVASHHRYDKINGVTLPRHVEIELPTIEMSFALDISDYIVNHISGDPATLWTMPTRGDAPVDLGRIARDSSLPIAPQTPSPNLAPPAASRLLAPQFGPKPSDRSFYDR